MKTRCKFKCTETISLDGGAEHEAEFEPVFDGSPENDEFFAETPGGLLSLHIMKEQHFEMGREYYLDLTLVEEPVSAKFNC